MKIGVLASQGSFAEHITALRRLGVEAISVRLPGELVGLDGLIIPGGESTSISKLMLDFNLANEIKDLVRKGMPVFGTCAGMILMSENVTGSYPETLGLMALTAKRNAFGRQKDSFETELSVPVLGDMPFPAVFIRAPVIRAVNGKAKILAKLADGTPVAARQDTMLVSAFHPEPTDDLRFHRYFIDIVAGKK